MTGSGVSFYTALMLRLFSQRLSILIYLKYVIKEGGYIALFSNTQSDFELHGIEWLHKPYVSDLVSLLGVNERFFLKQKYLNYVNLMKC
jgi:hypothetical protein